MEQTILIAQYIALGITAVALIVAAILMVAKRANGALESKGCSANSQTKPSVAFIGKRKLLIKGVILRLKGGKRVLVGSAHGVQRVKISRLEAA